MSLPAHLWVADSYVAPNKELWNSSALRPFYKYSIPTGLGWTV